MRGAGDGPPGGQLRAPLDKESQEFQKANPATPSLPSPNLLRHGSDALGQLGAMVEDLRCPSSAGLLQRGRGAKYCCPAQHRPEARPEAGPGGRAPARSKIGGKSRGVGGARQRFGVHCPKWAARACFGQSRTSAGGADLSLRPILAHPSVRLLPSGRARWPFRDKSLLFRSSLAQNGGGGLPWPTPRETSCRQHAAQGRSERRFQAERNGPVIRPKAKGTPPFRWSRPLSWESSEPGWPAKSGDSPRTPLTRLPATGSRALCPPGRG